MIEIRSKQEGFRRCGVAHSIKPAAYPGDRFTREEWRALDEEPMLIVTPLPEDGENEDRAVFEARTIAELKTSLDHLEIEYPGNARKSDLIDLIMQNTSRGMEE